MITIPIFMPLVKTLGIDPLWFCLVFLICQKTGGISPPFGMVLFTMKSVAPESTTMSQIYSAGIPFFLLDLAAVVVMLLIPSLATWLPGLMGSI
jgi:TRAP-type mannitol/chloroaromatic compound transport system permease large subunit